MSPGEGSLWDSQQTLSPMLTLLILMESVCHGNIRKKVFVKLVFFFLPLAENKTNLKSRDFAVKDLPRVVK